MNKYEIVGSIEFTVMADNEDKAIEIADDKLSFIPASFKLTGLTIREELV